MNTDKFLAQLNEAKQNEAAYLKSELTKKGYTQRKLAEALDVSHMTINNYLNGKVNIPHDHLYSLRWLITPDINQFDFEASNLYEDNERLLDLINLFITLDSPQRLLFINYLEELTGKPFPINSEVPDTIDNKAEISKRIRYFLRVKGVSQKELSEKTGISRSTISDYINEKYVMNNKNLELIAEVFDIDKSFIDPTFDDNGVYNSLYDLLMNTLDDNPTIFYECETFLRNLTYKYSETAVIDLYHSMEQWVIAHHSEELARLNQE